MQVRCKMQVRSLGREDPLEKGTAIHSSILDWRIPWTEETGRLQSIESNRVGHEWSNLAHMQAIIILNIVAIIVLNKLIPVRSIMNEKNMFSFTSIYSTSNSLLFRRIQYHFPSFWRISFISYKVDLLVTSLFNFCLSGKVSICSSLLRDNFAG